MHKLTYKSSRIFENVITKWTFLRPTVAIIKTKSAGATTTRRGALSRRFTSHFGAHNCI